MSEPSIVTLLANGPLKCRGSITIDGQTKDEVYLCRCGLSANKPFCDGSHNGAFTDPGALATDASATNALEAETLEVTLMDDGPILVKGAFQIADADGNVVATKRKGALCRCGASTNKPFCDGAHKGCGFRS